MTSTQNTKAKRKAPPKRKARAGLPAQAQRQRRPAGVVPDLLKLMRTRRGFTQDDLAIRARIAQSLVSQLEHGWVEIEVGTLKRICLALNVSADYLMGLPELPWK